MADITTRTGPVSGPKSVPDVSILDDLAARIAGLPARGRRLRVAVAGPPGSGKSTLAEALAAHLNRAAPQAALVPMDGFHLDNRILDERGLRARKGAPETFDAAGFVHMVARLGTEDEVVVPVFDRGRDIAIAGASVVARSCRIAVVEGNYLLLRQAPWSELRGLWDLSVFLAPPPDVLRARLVRRWLDHGLDADAGRARVDANDMPNASLVLEASTGADIVL